MAEYFEHPDLADVYLEDSFVLGLHVEPTKATLDIELVLKESHSLFEQPKEGEQYCYKRARIQYTELSSVSWKLPTHPPVTDSSGEADYGGIDTYTIDMETHHFTGEIGDVEIVCRTFAVEFDSES